MKKLSKSKVKKMKKSELYHALYYCPMFRLKKRGAFEMLGIMRKDSLVEYYIEFCLCVIKNILMVK